MSTPTAAADETTWRMPGEEEAARAVREGSYHRWLCPRLWLGYREGLSIECREQTHSRVRGADGGPGACSGPKYTHQSSLAGAQERGMGHRGHHGCGQRDSRPRRD